MVCGYRVESLVSFSNEIELVESVRFVEVDH